MRYTAIEIAGEWLAKMVLRVTCALAVIVLVSGALLACYPPEEEHSFTLSDGTKLFSTSSPVLIIGRNEPFTATFYLEDGKFEVPSESLALCAHLSGDELTILRCNDWVSFTRGMPFGKIWKETYKVQLTDERR